MTTRSPNQETETISIRDQEYQHPRWSIYEYCENEIDKLVLFALRDIIEFDAHIGWGYGGIVAAISVLNNLTTEEVQNILQRLHKERLLKNEEVQALREACRTIEGLAGKPPEHAFNLVVSARFSPEHRLVFCGIVSHCASTPGLDPLDLKRLVHTTGLTAKTVCEALDHLLSEGVISYVLL
jgi:hypothetical protein